MTASKEKALQLCNDMFSGSPFDYPTEQEFYYAKNEAKRCALIAVDEILKQAIYVDGSAKAQIDFMDYWQEVKNEINQL